MSITSFGQETRLTGRVLDRLTEKGISYSILKLANSSKVITANSEGSFEIKLPQGKNELVTSCIGYNSDTLLINIDSIGSKYGVSIYLNPSKYNKEAPTVEKSFSAFQIVSHAIAEKEKMLAKLENYEFDAYNRCVVRENNDVGIGTGSIRVSPGIFKETISLVSNIWQEKQMKINRIYEFISKGYYKSPSSYSESYENRKARYDLPPALSFLFGTRRIQNLCNDELLFFDRPMPGPASPAAINYYKYSSVDTLKIDNKRVFKIKFEPIDNNDPGLIGHLFIADGSYKILKIEADLNLAANVGNNFEKVAFIQQYIAYKDSIYLPVDYRIFVTSNYIGIVKIKYEFSSLMDKYKINSQEAGYAFSSLTIPPIPESTEKDTTSCTDNRALPFTEEEAIAFEKIDNNKSFSTSYVNTAGKILSPQYRLNDHYSISGITGIYQFNHVEGHTLNISGSGNNLFNNTLNAKINLSNGFSDKKSKESFSAEYYPDDALGERVSFNVYNKLATLFSSSNMYSPITTTIYSLLSRRDVRNYYYTSGFDFTTEVEPTSFMSIYFSYSNHVDHSAKTNTTFSLLGNNLRRNYGNNNNTSNFALPDSVNLPIYDVRLNTISFGINFDFRNDIIENNLKRKESEGHSFLSYGAGILISDPKYLGSGIGFISYGGNLFGELNTFGTSSLGISINGVYSNGPVPMQMQYALAGNISTTGRDHSFRTIGVGSMFGDQVLAMTLEYNFRKEIYRMIPLSILRNISVSSFFNAAWKNISDKSAAIMPFKYTMITKPLFETGFSFGYSSLPVSLELAWRLTQMDRSSFRFGINTSIL